MTITLPLERMTTADKLEVMETLWADLSRDESAVPSPAWHEEVLRRRDEASPAGREIPLDWETARQKLRDLRA